MIYALHELFQRLSNSILSDASTVDSSITCFGVLCVFFFQAEDGIRDCLLSRGLGDVYKRQ